MRNVYWKWSGLEDLLLWCLENVPHSHCYTHNSSVFTDLGRNSETSGKIWMITCFCLLHIFTLHFLTWLRSATRIWYRWGSDWGWTYSLGWGLPPGYGTDEALIEVGHTKLVEVCHQYEVLMRYWLRSEILTWLRSATSMRYRWGTDWGWTY